MQRQARLPLRTRHSEQQDPRRGAIIVLCVVMMLVVIGFAAFTVDFGVATLTKAQIQSAADSAAHAAAMEIARGFGPGQEVSASEAEAAARARAVEMVARFKSGDLQSTNADPTRDVRFGRRSWNSADELWVEEWGVEPYNMVEVTVRRTEEVDAAVPTAFARVFGHESFSMEATSVAALSPGVGFYLEPDSPEKIAALPFALDLGTWNSLLDQIYKGTDNGFEDNYRYYEETDTVVSGYNAGDGIPEVNIYPHNNSSLPPGNRGTVDLGSPNNSTDDLIRQIEEGLSADDLSYYPNNKIQFDSTGALYLNGDTGISAGMKSSLDKICGEIRCIPIFIEVSGPGNNAMYTVVKFVGVRVLDCKLTGRPSGRHLTVQPAVFSSTHVIRSNVPVTMDAILSQPITIR